MRISLVGDFNEPDEARKVMAHHFLKEMSGRHDVLPFNVRSTFDRNARKQLRDFKPDVIQYIPGASTYSFFAARTLKSTCKNIRTVMFTALHGFHGFSYGAYYGISTVTKPLIRLMKSDLVLVQSPETEKIFRGLGCNVRFSVYSGVDTNRFKPADQKRKLVLREKYQLDPERYTVLHVGSVRKWRNVGFLKDITKNKDIQFVLVGRGSTKFEDDTAKSLRESGVKIIESYTPDIQELYELSDCYMFPTINPIGSIDVPLSVLEAMSANLPVITTSFGGLRNIFPEVEGLRYARESEFDRHLADLRESKGEVCTRNAVLPYSWSRVAVSLENIYGELSRR